MSLDLGESHKCWSVWVARSGTGTHDGIHEGGFLRFLFSQGSQEQPLHPVARLALINSLVKCQKKVCCDRDKSFRDGRVSLTFRRISLAFERGFISMGSMSASVIF